MAACVDEVAEGTSPRTRGKHYDDDNDLVTERNIPAHAGKTHAYLDAIEADKEHPRARGENSKGTRWASQ